MTNEVGKSDKKTAHQDKGVIGGFSALAESLKGLENIDKAIADAEKATVDKGQQQLVDLGLESPEPAPTKVPSGISSDKGRGETKGAAIDSTTQGVKKELEGFDPSQNVNITDPEQGAELERQARANALRDLTDLLGAQFEDLPALLEAEQARRGDAELSADIFADVVLGAATGQGPSEEEKALIDEIAEAQIAQQSSDIDAALQKSLESLREESGAARGLRFTDTPVFDVAQDVTSEAVRQQAQGILGVRSAQAQATLDRPFQSAQLALGAQSFQEQLAQQAFANRAQLFGQTQGLGLDLLGASPSNQDFLQGLRSLQTQRDIASQANRTQRDIAFDPFNRAVSLASGAGTVAAAILSDRNAKQNIEEMSVKDLAEKFSDLRIDMWEYIPEVMLGNERRMGPMAQELQRVFGIGDGRSVAMVDVMGLVSAAGKMYAATLKKEAANG